jgi:hypothetical protein
MEKVITVVGTAVFSILAEAFKNILPLAIIAMIFIIWDCVEAWRLSRRVKLAGSQSSGKFKSEKFSKTVFKMIIYIPSGLMLAYFVQLYVLEGVNAHLPQIFCGIVIFWQF